MTMHVCELVTILVFGKGKGFELSEMVKSYGHSRHFASMLLQSNLNLPQNERTNERTKVERARALWG